MKVRELIAKLQALPPAAMDYDVQALDLEVNCRSGASTDPDGTNAGCYRIEDVELLDRDFVPEDTELWVALHFTNRDFQDNDPEA
jgi:hypothetical protein